MYFIALISLAIVIGYAVRYALSLAAERADARQNAHWDHYHHQMVAARRARATMKAQQDLYEPVYTLHPRDCQRLTVDMLPVETMRLIDSTYTARCTEPTQQQLDAAEYYENAWRVYDPEDVSTWAAVEEARWEMLSEEEQQALIDRADHAS